MLSLIILGGIFIILVILLIIIVSKSNSGKCNSQPECIDPTEYEDRKPKTKKFVNKGPLGEAGNTIVEYTEDIPAGRPTVVSSFGDDKSFIGIQITHRQPENNLALEDSPVQVEELD
jgi:hypothetical protein